MKKIKYYESFLQERKDNENSSILNEGFFNWIKDNILSKLKGWSGKFLNAIKKGLIKTIPSGENKGKPIAMLFTPEMGNIETLMEDFLSKTSTITENSETTIEYLSEGVGEDAEFVSLSGDNYDLLDQSTEEIKQHIRDYWAARRHDAQGEDSDEGTWGHPIMIFGAPGIGKSQIVASMADEFKCDLLYMDLQYFAPEDFRGIPVPMGETTPRVSDIKDPEGNIIRQETIYPKGRTIQFLPSMFPEDNGSNGNGGIIFLDEANRANNIVINSLLQFIEPPHRIDNYILPSKWIIILAGNRAGAGEGKNVYNFNAEPQISTRFGGMYNYVPTLKEWQDWNKTKKDKRILPEIFDFIEEMRKLNNVDYFHRLQKNAGGNFPCPRTWEKLSGILKSAAKERNLKDWKQLDANTLQVKSIGAVGKEAGSAFVQYIKLGDVLTEAEMQEILTNPNNVRLLTQTKSGTKQGFDLSIAKTIIDKLISEVKENDPKWSNKFLNILIYANRHAHNNLVTLTYDQLKNRFKMSRGGHPTSKFDTSSYEVNGKPVDIKGNPLTGQELDVYNNAKAAFKIFYDAATKLKSGIQ